MTKRFTETISTGIVTDNLTGREYKCEYCIDDALLEVLNELHEENQQLKKQIQSIHTMLNNAILLERTRMGKNCLKQFKEAIE